MPGIASQAKGALLGCSVSSGSSGSGMGSCPGGGWAVRPHGPRCCMAMFSREPHSSSGAPSR
eukprot:12427038-Prorocentrum_lima.AAC.1